MTDIAEVNVNAALDSITDLTETIMQATEKGTLSPDVAHAIDAVVGIGAALTLSLHAIQAEQRTSNLLALANLLPASSTTRAAALDSVRSRLGLPPVQDPGQA